MRTAVPLLLAALALLGLASATINPAPHVAADKDFLLRQKRLLQILWHVGQPILDPELKEIASSFKLEDHAGDFKDPELVKTYLRYYAHGFFKKRGEQFSVHHKYDQLEAKALVDILYQAKDFDTFFKTAVWAREHLNEGLFVYALNVAKLHRDDLFDVVLPPFYEIYPQLYVSSDVIREAWGATLEGKTFDKDHPYVIRANYSGYPRAHNADELLSYYTEDIGLGAYLDFIHYRYPFWAKLSEYNQANYTRRGDHFYYGIKATLSRYYLERLSNHLPDIEPVDYKRPVPGSKPYGPFVQYLSTLERRLWEAVDFGSVFDSEFKKYSLRDPLSIEIFGRIVEGNADSINRDYYGSFYNSLLKYLGHDGDHHHGEDPSVLDRPASTFKSPLYYKIVKRIALILDQFKKHLPPYSQKELSLPGVKVESLTVDKLVTYFEDYDFELNNAIPVASIEEAANLNVVARVPRLTHKPFNYHVKVTSDKDVDVFVRFFIGPRYDVYGNELSLNEKRHNFVYIDSFVFNLKKGENELVRNSKDFNYYGQLPLSYRKLYEATEAAIAGGNQPFIDDFVHKYGDIERLAVPRGTRSGLPLSTYVIITPFTHKTISRINPYTDDVGAKISLFPFDRPINELDFDVSNSHFGETVVIHRNAEEVAAA
ncbi:allergen Cr-PI-like [Schistocerca serialis cubense]|uniref:allergen Cr-PI-like n=1 Tax=Schistocerca serialis cubense TaxID=2023355 RepID=UPI00214E28F2|nr:allergen Cr-PI-like [Schistocerca serialis cubense]